MYSSLYGLYSFGLIQANYFEQAKLTAIRALQMNRHDAWATHTLSHFYEYSTDYESGTVYSLLNKSIK